MRRQRRRCPAGQPRVPEPSLPPEVAVPVEPAIVRLGPDRSVLDAPWDARGAAIALVWPDDRALGGWMRVEWPIQPATRRLVAPVDLHIGHVLEVGVLQRGGWSAIYGWVAAADGDRFVLVPATSAVEAVVAARRAVDVWRAGEFAALGAEWLLRIDAANRLQGRAQ